MYDSYLEIIRQINSNDELFTHFKQEQKYRDILEHVCESYGREYLQYIKKEFSFIKATDIINFTKINDRIGDPIKTVFYIDGQEFLCSPSSLRYIYHALLILKTMQTQDTENVIELGCGYGGLFMAIHFFKNLYYPDVMIDKYYMMDLPDVLNLIDKYLQSNGIQSTNYTLIDTFTLGKDIPSKDNFLISNYCLTELPSELREKYYNNLIPKCKGGFIIWQTGWTPLEEMKHIPNATYEEERPQTSPSYLNYFVRF